MQNNVGMSTLSQYCKPVQKKKKPKYRSTAKPCFRDQTNSNSPLVRSVRDTPEDSKRAKGEVDEFISSGEGDPRTFASNKGNFDFKNLSDKKY